MRQGWTPETGKALGTISEIQSELSKHEDTANYTIAGLQGYLGTVYALTSLGKLTPSEGVRIASDVLDIVHYSIGDKNERRNG